MEKNSSSYIQYNRLTGLCKKLNNQINRHFYQVRFYTLTKEYQYKLLKLIEKIKTKVAVKLSAVALTFGLLIGATALQAQAPQGGTEFLVSLTLNNAIRSDIAMNKTTGDVVIVWEESQSNRAYGHRYNLNGISLGTDFFISTGASSPSVAVDKNGNFVVAYHRMFGNSNEIFARRYNAAGKGQGDEFMVNTYTSNNQSRAAVAMNSNGDFVITWNSQRNNGLHNGIYAQMYNAAGVAQDTEFRVNTYTSASSVPDIAMDDIGNFVIVWESTGQDVPATTSTGIYAQRFNATGLAQGSEFRINTLTPGDQAEAAIAMDSDGDFAVTWTTYSDAASSTVNAIKGQRFNAIAIPQGAEFQVNAPNTAYAYWDSDIAMDQDGNFVVTWGSQNGQDGSQEGVYAKRYDAAGNTQQTDFLVNTYTTNDQSLPSIAMNDAGEYVIAWQSEGQYESGLSTIYAKTYLLNHIPAISNQTFTVPENTANGIFVGTVVASDADVGQLLTYAITAGNTAGKFVINSASGEITVNGSLDYETVTSYNLTIQVTDNGYPTRKNTTNINVNVDNVHEAPVVAPQSFSFAENATTGTVGTVLSTAEPGLTVQYSIAAGNTGGVFSINNLTGAITVNGFLNYEQKSSYALTVKVTDNGSPALSTSAVVTITVIDVNDKPVILSQTFSIAENSLNGAFVGTVVASDPDAGQILTYSINVGNTDNVFSINSSSGELRVNNSTALDYENHSVYSLSILVKDNGTPSYGTATLITITVTNVYELPFIEDLEVILNENAEVGTVVGTVKGSPDNNLGTYSIIDGNINNAFSIDEQTGLITLVKALNFSNNPLYTLTVQLTDSHVPANSATAVITITVIDVNDKPVILPQTFSIAENSANDAFVGTVVASDPDAGQILTYSINVGNTDNVFSINSSSGELRVNNSTALDYENHSAYSLSILVMDNGTPSYSTAALITITVTNVYELPLIEDLEVIINENAGVGTVVGTVEGSPDNNLGTYSIIDGNINNTFSIDEQTGVISLGKALNGTNNPLYSLTVQLIDSYVPANSVTAAVEINVITTTGIFSGTNSLQVILYPNPAVGSVHIELDGDAAIRILDLSGRLIKEEVCRNKMLNIEGLKAGVYIIEIMKDGIASTQKLVVDL